MIEIILVLLIFIACLILIRINFLSSVILALVLSTFLHKEMFSIYIWDLLPIRILMGAYILSSLYDFIKFNKFTLKFLRYLKDPFILLLILFVISKFISTVNSLDLKTSLFLNLFYLSIVNFIITLYLKLQARDILEILKKYIFIAFLVALVPFIQIYLYFNNNYLFGAILNVAGLNVDFPSFSFNYDFFTQALKLIVMTRLGSIFWDVNHFGGFLAGILMPSLAYALIAKDSSQRKQFIYFIFIGISLFLTNSRSAWIIAAVSTLVFFILLIYRKIGKKGVLYSLAGFVFMSVILFSMYQDKNSLFREKVRSYFHYRMDSFDSHFLLLQGAVEVFEKHPVIGGGTGSFFEHFKETTTSNEFLKKDPAGLSGRVPAHSIWGEVLAESGAVGVFIFVAICLLSISILIYSLIHSRDSMDYLLYSSFIGSLIGWLVAGIFYSYNSEFYFILFFLPIIYCLKNQKIVFEELFYYFKKKNLYTSIFISLICFSLVFIGLGNNKVITFDESIYAKVSKNMFETGDLFTLTWRSHQDLWFEKPPLYFIVTAFFYSIFGVTEFATRFTVSLFSILGLLYTYKLAKLIFNSSFTGIMAVLGLVLNVSYLYYSRIGMLDVILTFFIVSSSYYFLKFDEDSKNFKLVLSGILLGLGVLVKSLIGFLPFIFFGVYYLINKFAFKNKSIEVKHLFIVFITSLIVALPWHFHMYQIHGDKFLKTYFGYHLIERYSSEIEDKGAPWDFYLVVIRNTMRVWYLILIPALVFFGYSFYKKQLPKKSIFLLISSLIILLLFSSSSSKLKWYIMPIYPFLYIIAGYFIFNIFNYLKKSRFTSIGFGLIFYIFLFLNLAYFYSVKDMVYTPDFNLKQATLLIKNNSLSSVEYTYIDKLDYHLVLFYNEKQSIEFMNYSQLKEVLAFRANDPVRITVITSKSRFENLKRIIPQLTVIEENDDFVLAYLN